MQDDQTTGPMLIGLKAVLKLTSLSRSTIWRLVRKGAFPAPRRLTERRRAWRSDEVASWIDGREFACGPQAEGASA